MDTLAASSNWDYCCQPQSRCGYSDGFNYPWCYVGAELSGQWRPCSDRFAERPYAYLHRSTPPNATDEAVAPVETNSFDPADQKDDEPARLASPSGAPTHRYVVKSNCANKTDTTTPKLPTP